LITQYTLVTLPCSAASLVPYLTAHLFQFPVFIIRFHVNSRFLISYFKQESVSSNRIESFYFSPNRPSLVHM